MSTEDLIEQALASGQAFVLPPSPRETRAPEPPIAAAVASETTADSAVDESEPTEAPSATPEPDAWKAEYDAQVEAWRAQSAEAREKAEKERARWEAIRKEEAEKRKAAGIPEVKEDIPTGLPTHRPKSDPPAVATTSSTVDIRPDSRQDTDTNEGSQKWEEVQAASTASFPSMSFPERTTPPSLAPAPQTSQAPPPTATLAIFDSSLSTRTRIVALFSALAINLALPFVNGVMLGFGEIFAKNVVLNWFGWRSVSVASNVGIGARRERTSVFR
ncbi:hypothetical protein CC1G_06401 [Coprinopsis cinerea okayama7|uniref:Proteophosphoglycan ppg4 n=1 Tax=Coprinopsis cinerea (strain Okayama-7 / 130 / ATCC MYA-4618 / FGSC 9003) TaxID=240176 RepID=A8NTW1_COPC7|nr:hypothetical protein CC1G_06401 [Coprinopsis cinerea okayama7\|eukprot:XP_001836316.1 hypothetical protein CC1G_06401 [Coprinopsis cinerea okayama7\